MKLHIDLIAFYACDDCGAIGLAAIVERTASGWRMTPDSVQPRQEWCPQHQQAHWPNSVVEYP